MLGSLKLSRISDKAMMSFSEVDRSTPRIRYQNGGGYGRTEEIDAVGASLEPSIYSIV